jgi:hypothetical protein
VIHCHASNLNRYLGLVEVLTLDTAFFLLGLTLDRVLITWKKDYDNFCVEVSCTLDQEQAVLQRDTG